jgi:hypothetical protein
MVVTAAHLPDGVSPFITPVSGGAYADMPLERVVQQLHGAHALSDAGFGVPGSVYDRDGSGGGGGGSSAPPPSGAGHAPPTLP